MSKLAWEAGRTRLIGRSTYSRNKILTLLLPLKDRTSAKVMQLDILAKIIPFYKGYRMKVEKNLVRSFVET